MRSGGQNFSFIGVLLHILILSRARQLKLVRANSSVMGTSILSKKTLNQHKLELNPAVQGEHVHPVLSGAVCETHCHTALFLFKVAFKIHKTNVFHFLN